MFSQGGQSMKSLSRRELFAGGAAAFTFLPARVLGRGGPAPSERLNVAVIGIGCRGEISVSELHNSGQNLVALCDVDWRPLQNYTHPRACDVIKRFPDAKRYDDWRIMLHEQEKNIDAVVVAAPDHIHAFASLTAMKMGKHVYCEKPLAHSIYEVRALIAAEKKYKVATQVGNQGHSSEDCINIVEWIRDGVIGDVKEVHLFLRTGIRGVEQPTAVRSYTRTMGYADIPKIVAEDHEVPKDLNWDLWLGPAPFRGFNPVYLPNNWRRWRDFGTGTLGDYNCHYMDPVMWALDLGLPERIEANPEAGFDPATNKQTFPSAAEIRWDFPARGSKPPVSVTWHYGGNSGTIPPPMGWTKDDKLPSGGGGAIYGSKGTLVFGPIYASHPRSVAEGKYKPVEWGTPGKLQLFPAELDASYKRPDPTLPRPFSHWMDWIEAAKAGRQPGSHFGYGGMLSQIALMGNIACLQKGTILHFDARKGEFKNNPDANKLFRRSYREGWKLPA
jgi:predicted dehydrogenase